MNTKNKSWITYCARVGYSAKFVIYLALGLLILYAAVGSFNAEKISKKFIFKEILSSPFGNILLFLVIVGLACYVSWRFIQGTLNPSELDMSKPKSVIERGFYFISALSYASVSYVAIKILLGSSENGNNNGGKSVSAKLMNEPFGEWAVAALGCLIIVFALIQFKHAIKQDFMDKFILDDAPKHSHRVIKTVGMLGFFGRGIVYATIGGFFVQSALRYEPEEAGGLSEALVFLLKQPYGFYLLMLVGVCMLGFSIFCAFEGRYRKT